LLISDRKKSGEDLFSFERHWSKNQREVWFSLHFGFCEMTEELGFGTRQTLERIPNEVCSFTSFGICEMAEEIGAGVRHERKVEKTCYF
jgi:hypothetical protein